MHVHVDSWIDTVNIQNVFYTEFEQTRRKSDCSFLVSVQAKFNLFYLCLTLRFFLFYQVGFVCFDAERPSKQQGWYVMETFSCKSNFIPNLMAAELPLILV